ELRAALADGPPPQLVDVREEWEKIFGTIEPSILLPISTLARGEGAAALAALDPSVPTVVYCAVGVRSLLGAQLLRERHGFRSARSLRGGIEEWKRGGK